ncbi:MAG TPA: hypothetical protein VMJ30_04370 [Gemmatimonadales bacterium]|nr:hypothetical protein [Gemmatimonadales bacterium]
MSGSLYFVLADPPVLVTSYWGRTVINESQRVRESRAADPGRRGVAAHLIDLSDLEGTTSPPRLEAETFRMLATSYARSFGSLPTAVLATAVHVYGLARVFETVGRLQDPPLPIWVVRSWDEAAFQLGMDLTEARAELARRRAAAGE